MPEAPSEPVDRCPRCGAPLSEGSPGGLCARCLLGLGLEGELTPPAEASGASGPPPPVDEHDAPERIGPYRLISVLGSGGMGVVYLAEQEQPLRRRVALKLIKRGMDSKAVLSRFESERQALALMDHPGIARVLDAGTSEDGRPFFVMEPVEGPPITEYCDRRRLGTRERLELLAEVCEAVQHAHAKGILHRDLKPSNVLVSEQDGRARPKVIDFGVAKALKERLTEQTFFTELGVIVGTPGYMSPEQAALSERGVDTRTDIYSLGVLGYELVCGIPPFDTRRLREAGWAEMLRIVREEEPARPSTAVRTLGSGAAETAQRRGTDAGTLARRLRGDVDWIVLKALEKDPERRYQSAYGLASDIRRHLRDEPVVAGPPTLGYRLSKALRRNKLAFAAAAAVAVAVVLALITSTAMYRQAEAARRESRQQVVRLDVAKAVELMDAGDKVASLPWLVQALRLEEDPQRREAHRYRIAAALDALPSLHRLWTHEGAVNDAVISLDGQTVASASADHTARTWSVSTGRAISPALRHEGAVTHIALSPDARRVATGSEDHTVRVWDASTGTAIALLRHGGPVRQVEFSPDGRQILTASDDQTASVWETETGRRTVVTRHGGAVIWASFSPDGRSFVAATADGFVRIWDAKTGRPRSGRMLHSGLTTAALSRDGRRVLTAGADRSSRVWSAVTGQPLTAPLAHSFNFVTQADFSPDGRYVALAVSDNRVYVWNVERQTLRYPPLAMNSAVGLVRFSPDGLRVVAGDEQGTIRVWRSTDAALQCTLRHPGAVRAVGFDASNSFLLTAALDGTVRVWNLATTAPLTPPTHRMFSRFTEGGDTVVDSGWGEGWGSREGFARAWSTETGDPRTPPMRHASRVAHDVSPDGRFVATAGVEDRTARLWDRNGEPIGCPLQHEERVFGIQLLPGSLRVLTFGWQDPRVHLWDVEEAREAPPSPLIAGSPVTGVAVTPDGRYAVTGSEHEGVRIWDLATGSGTPLPSQHHGYVSVAVSPDGQRLATADEKAIGLWSVPAGRPLWSPRPLMGEASLVVFSPDGTRLATGGMGGTVEIWDASTGRQASPPMQHEGVVTDARFSPDGRWLATASGDRTVRVWDSRTGEAMCAPYRDAWPLFSAAFDPLAHHLLAAKRVWPFRPDSRPLEDLERLAELLSGRRFVDGTSLERLPAADLARAWDDLHARHGESSRASALQIQAWHRERAMELLEEERWPEAKAHLDRALEAGPRRWMLLVGRGYVHAELEEWEEAAADYSAALDMIPGEIEPAFDLALIHLLRRDRTRYEALRQRLVERWAQTRNPDRARWAAHLLVLAPIPDATTRALAVQLGEAALEAEPGRPERWALHGAALVRAGRHEMGRRELERAIRNGEGNPPPTAFAFLSVLARQGRLASDSDTWRAELERALKRYREPDQARERFWQWTSSQLDLVPWERRAEARVLLAEGSAEGLQKAP